MKSNNLTILDRLNEIIESIELIEEWSRFAANASDFMLSPNGVMAFNACVMRLQVIGEDVGNYFVMKVSLWKDMTLYHGMQYTI